MRLRVAASFLLNAVIVVPAGAQNLESFRFQVDNDWFDFWQRSVDRPDDNYTAGHSGRAVFDRAPRWALFGQQDCATARRKTTPPKVCVESFIGVTQKMFTPTNDSFEPKPGERPYAGILFAEFGRQAVKPRSAHSLAAVIGTTGKPSGNEWEQKLFHSLADLRTPLGWNHQVATESVLGLTYKSQYMLTPPRTSGRSFATVAATGSAVATTVQEVASAGVETRFGYNVPHPWMPASPFERRNIRAYFILGGNESWVARNLLLTGNSAETRGLVTKRPFLFESVWGFALGAGGIFVEYRATSQSREYNTGPSWHRWGAISIIVGTPY
jgi:hypothetical protein